MNPQKKRSPELGEVQGSMSTQEDLGRVDCERRSFAEEAALHIEGEEYATAYLSRLRAGTAELDELAMLSGFMHSGPMLAGFTKVIRKALRTEGPT